VHTRRRGEKNSDRKSVCRWLVRLRGGGTLFAPLRGDWPSPGGAALAPKFRLYTRWPWSTEGTPSPFLFGGYGRPGVQCDPKIEGGRKPFFFFHTPRAAQPRSPMGAYRRLWLFGLGLVAGTCKLFSLLGQEHTWGDRRPWRRNPNCCSLGPPTLGKPTAGTFARGQPMAIAQGAAKVPCGGYLSKRGLWKFTKRRVGACPGP